MTSAEKRDPSHFRRTEDATQAVSESAKLADAAMALLGCTTPDAVYEVIADFMTLMCPGAVVVVDEIAPDFSVFVTRKVVGVEHSLIAKVAGLVGFDLVGKRWAIPASFREVVLSGTLSKIPGGFADIAAADISHKVSSGLTRMFGIHDLFVIGIADGTHVLGNFAILTREPNVALPTHLIESFAHQCYSALAGIERDRELARSAAQAQAILSGSPVPMAVNDAGLRITFVNSAFVETFGYTLDDLLSLEDWWESAYPDPEYREGVMQAWAAGLQTAQREGTTFAPIQVTVRCKDGTDKTILASTAVMPGSDGPGHLVVLYDITDREQARTALALSESKFSTAFHTSPDAVNINRLSDGLYVDVNEGFTELTGYTAQDVEGRTSGDIDIWVDPSDRERLVAGLRAEGVVDNLEAEFRRKDGSIATALMSARVIDVGGVPHILSITRDISARKQAEAAVQQSHDMLVNLTDQVPGVVYQYRLYPDGRSCFPFSSRGMNDIYEYSPEEVREDAAPVFERLHPEDYDRVSALIMESARTLEPFHCEFRVVLPRQGLQWRMSDALPQRTEDGGTLWYGIISDITEQKDLEAALQQRLVALTQPPSATSGLTFADLFDVDEIQTIQDAFSNATGVASIITKPDGTPITRPSNFCRLCTDLIRGTEKGQANCFKSDSMIGRSSASGPVVQVCMSGGLWDAGASISAGGEHVANWLIGQVRNERQDEAAMLDYADQIGVDRAEFVAALAEVPMMSLERFELIAQALFSVAKELSTVAYQNVQQARFITERQEMEEARTHDLERLTRALWSTVEIVGQVVETRDPYTAGHQRRVSELSVRIAEQMGMAGSEVGDIRTAALLHDVGKMAIPAEILSKPGDLSPVEFELIKSHSETGRQIIASADMEGPTAEIIHQHHERCDGSGYPRGLRADQLLPAAKVIMVADVVEAMMSHRPYRPALGQDLALAEIEAGAGTLYDPGVYRACAAVFLEHGFEFSRA
jgi:PAS domain S-box-containing protein/putative nucleotidyltransferase with HDIG domain